MSFLAELKRRNVFKVGAAYLALAWLVLQLTSIVVPAFELPAWTLKFVIWFGVIGFPCVLVFAWIYELTPDGLKRDSEVDRSQSITHVTGKRLDYIIIAMLAVAIGLFLLQYLRPPAPGEPAANEAAATPATTSVLQAESPAAPQSAAAISPDDKSIAVLPFVNMSSDKEQEYFSDGMTEEVLNLLSRVPQLKVIARTSSFAFKGQNLEVREIARRLGVANVLEGSVRKSGNTLRITAQLIEAASGTHLWSGTWDRELADVFAIQDEIAGAVVKQLKVTLLGELPKARVVDPKAYALYLQARALHLQFSPASISRAIELYKQSLSIDSSNAPAWRGLGSAYDTMVDVDAVSQDESRRLSREALEKAMTADPTYGAVHAKLGEVALFAGDTPEAARLMRRALELDPADPQTLIPVSRLQSFLGHDAQAIALLTHLVDRDPSNPALQITLGARFIEAGRSEEALACFRTARDLSPAMFGVHSMIGIALLMHGDPTGALAEFRLEADEAGRLLLMAMANHASGQAVESDAAIAEFRDRFGSRNPGAVAAIHAFRGETDQAFQWLDKVKPGREREAIWMHRAFVFDPLHADPRWLAFLREIGRAPEQLAAIKFDVKVPQQ